MNIVFGLLLICVFTYLGKRYAVRYNIRRDFFADFYKFNGSMTAEMTFGRRTLTELEQKGRYQSPFALALKYCIDRAEPPDFKTLLTPEENDFLENYFLGLGKSDGVTQLKMFESAEAPLKKYKDDAQEKAVKYSALSVRLSFLFGLMAFILII